MPQPQYQLTLTHLPPDIPASLLGQTIRLKRLPTTVGRGKDAGITVKHRSLSRLHCRFYTTNGRLAVKDLASTNGTLINGFRITDDSYLQVGDHITFGSIVFQLSLLNDSVNHREPEAVPESAQPDTPVAPDQSELNQPPTDQIAPYTSLKDELKAQAVVNQANENGVPLDLVQKTSDRNASRDAVEHVEAYSEDSAEELFVEVADPDEEQDLGALIEDSNEDLAQACEFSGSSSIAELQSSRNGNGESVADQVPKGFQADQSVVFFESDPSKVGQSARPESVTKKDEKDAANEREMSVEGAAEREDVASIMRRHQLGSPNNIATKADESISLDDNTASTPTPIIQDRPEDRPSANIKKAANENVIDIDVPNSGPKVSSINIETSFVAGGSNIDLGDFMKNSLTGKPTKDDLVIDEPVGEGPSMTALGEFFNRKKD